MTTSSTTSARHLIAVPARPSAISDTELAAWRDAAASGAFPEPTLDRWQALRAGVINLWEFDNAEYWFADGRAQFVGANQCGKSTLMALTTLTLLAGDLDRRYVDTFGENYKSFRYYVEPTDDPRDRREATETTNRGWAWVEYGRLGPDGPQFFTTLLYAQAKRAVPALNPVWVVCTGDARVRAGLRLAEGQATVVPAELSDIPGVTVCGSGEQYTRLLSAELYGFSETERLATVVEMLKVLRTPHLGQKLNPGWFTEQMRTALPAIARTEIDELAEGWQQLEQIGADRDSAATARDAVSSYLRRAWRPWADAVLRRAADELIRTNTAFDDVTRRVRAAETTLETAQEDLTAAQTDRERLNAAAGRAQVSYEEMLNSQAYQDATARTARAETLRVDAQRARREAGDRAEEAERAAKTLSRAQQQVTLAGEDLETAHAALIAAAGRAEQAVAAARLGEQAVGWAQAHDTDRLDAAVDTRRAQLRQLRKLLSAAQKAASARELAAERAGDAQRAYRERDKAAHARGTELDEALQRLSNELERWAAGLADDAPDIAVREQWVDAVTAQTREPRPRGMLRERVRVDWLDPAIRPLTENAAVHATRAEDLRRQGTSADREADALEQATDPVPDPPAGWTRRHRPQFPSAAGAPLWRLLDPVDGLDRATVDQVEAALAAAGLLDAWVSPDGMWLADRDGSDVVIAPPSAADGPTLSTLLQPAADSGPLAGTVRRWLSSVAYIREQQPLSGAVTVAADGRWRTPTAAGHAAVGPHGATLLGTAARAAHRTRMVSMKRAEAAALRTQAEGEDAAAAQLREQRTALQTAASTAPDDASVIRRGLAAAAAERERAEAEQTQTRRDSELVRAEEQADLANTAVLNYAAENALPTGSDSLDDAGRAVDLLAAAVTELRLAVTGKAAAANANSAAVDRHRQAEEDHTRAAAFAADRRAAAEEADLRADEARRLLGRNDTELFERKKQLDDDRTRLAGEHRKSEETCRELSTGVERADQQLAAQGLQRQAAEAARSSALEAWWVPVDAGLAEARGLPAAPGRSITSGRDQATAARQQLRPQNWPDSPDAIAEKTSRVEAALSRLNGTPLTDLRTILESSGGRSASYLDAEETGTLPAVVILVDSSGAQVSPSEAVARLDAQYEKLAELHDQKMHQVLVELLSSAFVEHLRDRLAGVVALLGRVNRVLEAHPTGANRTTLRLRRTASEGQRGGFDVLRTLERGFIDDPEVQEQIRTFLADRIREAQELGRATQQEWIEHLRTLLDYRRWFDVVTDFRVGTSDWRPLTRQVHGADSGGGKVVTLLQPLLATLVALYDESPTAPRPLWLDEAFEGVDAGNRATMLDLLVDFNLDFLLAGPGQLVAAAQVPTAAVWFISRAPAPLPGVHLGLSLWAGRTLQQIPIPDLAVSVSRPRPSTAPAEDLFSAGAGDEDNDTP